MDFKISSRIWNTNLPSGEKTVLLALDHSGDQDGFSWQGYARLAEMTGISAESKYLTRILNKLEEKGYILIWRQHGHKGGRGYTHIYWPIIGRTDDQILEIVMRRFVATEDEARAIISQSGPIYEELVKRNRVSAKILEQTQPRKGVPQYTYDDKKGVPEYPNSDEKVLPETPKSETEDQKGVPGTPRINDESDNDNDEKIDKDSSLKQTAILELYHNNIRVSEAPLTYDEIKSTEYLSLPFRWWRQAVKVATDNGVYKWSYIRAILDCSREANLEPAKVPKETWTKGRYENKSNKKGPVKGESDKYTFPPPPDPIPPPPEPEYIAIWESAKSQVRDQMTGATFDTLFKDAQPIERENGTFELRVKASALEMIEHRPKVKANILTALQAVKPEIHDVDFKELKL